MKLQKFVSYALESSIFASPHAPGLTLAELIDLGSQFQLMRGEIVDYTKNWQMAHGRLFLHSTDCTEVAWFTEQYDPDFRNKDAFRFIVAFFRQLQRAEGVDKARVTRSAIVAEGVAKGIPEHDLEGALTCYLGTDAMKEKDGLVFFNSQLTEGAFEIQNKIATADPDRMKAYNAVDDIIRRRTSGTNVSKDPLKSFSARIEGLGQKRFVMWWRMTLEESERSDPHHHTIAACVLAAALVEGALSIAAPHAIATKVTNLDKLDADPKKWKLLELARHASNGQDPILSPALRGSVETLNSVRQRIHAGNLLANATGPLPDTRPEEATQAKETTKAVVRALLDWLDRHPTP